MSAGKGDLAQVGRGNEVVAGGEVLDDPAGAGLAPRRELGGEGVDD